jgi:hypothetical protein
LRTQLNAGPVAAEDGGGLSIPLNEDD